MNTVLSISISSWQNVMQFKACNVSVSAKAGYHYTLDYVMFKNSVIVDSVTS